jgi:hypothetical protein
MRLSVEYKGAFNTENHNKSNIFFIELKRIQRLVSYRTVIHQNINRRYTFHLTHRRSCNQYIKSIAQIGS